MSWFILIVAGLFETAWALALKESDGFSKPGPTVVFLCESADGARATAVGLAGAGHDVVLTATGPVAGAHVLA